MNRAYKHNVPATALPYAHSTAPNSTALIPWSRVPETSTCYPNQEIPLVSSKRNVRRCSKRSAIGTQSYATSNLFITISILIVFSHAYLGHQNGPSVLRVLPPKACTHSCTLPCVPHAPPLSTASISPSNNILHNKQPTVAHLPYCTKATVFQTLASQDIAARVSRSKSYSSSKQHLKFEFRPHRKRHASPL